MGHHLDETTIDIYYKWVIVNWKNIYILYYKQVMLDMRAAKKNRQVPHNQADET